MEFIKVGIVVLFWVVGTLLPIFATGAGLYIIIHIAKGIMEDK